MTNSSLKKSKGSKSGLGRVVAALSLIALIGGAFYGGLLFFEMRNSRKIVCLCSLADEGLLVYNRICFDPDSPGTSLLKEVLPGDDMEQDGSGWSKIDFSQKVRFLGETGQRSSLEEIFGDPPSEAVVEVTVGPDKSITKVSSLGGSFHVEGPISEFEPGKITVEKTVYDYDDHDSLEAGQGDIVKLYGFGGRILRAQVVKKAGLIEVSANLEGAKIFVDGTFVGKAPVSFKVPPGTRMVMAKLDSYETTSVQAEVISMQTTQVSVELPLITGTLEITSTPSNAEIYVNGDFLGTTDFTLLLKPGSYDISVRLDGYYSKKAKADLFHGAVVALRFDLVKETQGISAGFGTGGSSGLQAKDQVQGTRITVLSYDPVFSVLKGLGSTGSEVSVQIPKGLPLENTRSSWDQLLPGEEITVEKGTSGDVLRAVKTYSYSFSSSGRVLSRTGNVIGLGDSWQECILSTGAIVQNKKSGALSATLSVGDFITVYGPSASDIRYVSIDDTLGGNSSFEGFLVKTKDGLEIFGDSSVMWFKIEENLDVVDHNAKKKDRAGAVPSGSRLRFYMDDSGNIVWAEYVWKADLSVEGRIALLTGPVVSIMPSWKDVTISQDTCVFFGRDKRFFYDIRVGDNVLASGPRAGDVRFILINDRIESDRTVEGFMGAAGGKQGRVFYEIERSGSAIPWIVDSDLAFSWPEERTTLAFKDVHRGDKVRLRLTAGGKPVWGEVLERNSIDLPGHYLGKNGGFLYFTGFTRLVPAKNLTMVGISDIEDLYPGSLVFVGGSGGTVNYLEVEGFLEKPWREVDGTVISVDNSKVIIQTSRYSVAEYEIAKDTWFVDWSAKTDGSVQTLHSGDEVTVSVGTERTALFFERTYSPRFKVSGTVTDVSGRAVIVTGDYGTFRAEMRKDAYVYKDGGITDYTAVEKGDKVSLSGTDADSIGLVVVK